MLFELPNENQHMAVESMAKAGALGVDRRLSSGDGSVPNRQSHEQKPRNVRVNAVAPGPIWTPLIPSTFPEDHVELWAQVQFKNLVRQRLSLVATQDAVLISTANVNASETYLETDQGVSSIPDGPENPQNIAQQKEPKSPIPVKFSL